MAGKLALKIMSACLTLAIIAGTSAVVCTADDLSDYEKRQKELDSKAKEYQSVIDKTASDIAQKEEYKEALLSKISVLNEQIITGRTEIESLDSEIMSLQNEIDDSKFKISDRIDALKQRVKAIYLSGETTSLEIILGAKDFEDFLDKLELVSYMSNSDKKMIDGLQNDIDLINKKKTKMDDKKAQLAEEQNNLNKRQQEMQKLIDENQATLDGLYESNAHAQDSLDENNAERQKIEDAIMAYFADKEAQARNAKIASEAEKKLTESRKVFESSITYGSGTDSTSSSSQNHENTTSTYEPDNSTNGTSSENTVTSKEESSSQYVPSTPSNVESTEPEPEPEPPITSSGYVWPVPGHYILSSQWNEDRDSYNHGAIDISDGSVMNAEVVAAESGTVVLSNDDCTHNYGKDGSCGCGGGYGNYLMIDHGDGKATLYAHLTSLTVSSGTYVQKGEVIGYVGSTGWSTGPHLHFETRLNGIKYNPMTEYPNM